MFHSVSPVTIIQNRSAPVSETNGLLRVLNNDVVLATPVACGNDAKVASALVDPAGVVFDARSNAPVAGAVVALIDVTGAGNGGRPGEPAVVFGADGVSPYASTITTGSDGAFVFPLVEASTYRLSVAAPGYTFPSKVVQAELPPATGSTAAARTDATSPCSTTW